MVGKNRFTQDQGRRIAEQKKMHQTQGYVDALRLLEIGTLRVCGLRVIPLPLF